MNFLIKTILYIATFFLFSFLIFYTFLSPQYEKIKSLSINNTFEKYAILNNTGSSSNIFIENISKIDSIYYSNSGSYNKKTKDQNIEFKLAKGKFILNINDLTKNYTFSNTGFTIKPLGSGIFYIDTSNKYNIKIFSKESVLKIGFRDLKSGNILNTAYLYPHEYIIINPLRNRSIKNNADFIRIKSQVFKSGYISNKVSYNNNNTKGLLGRLLGETNLYFFNHSLEDINLKNIDEKEKYNKIKKISYWIFPGKSFIEKYMLYFYNNSKKVIYYKNNIIRNNLTLFGRNDLKTYILRNKIKENLIKLKDINKYEYEQMIGFTNYISNIVLSNNSLEDNLGIKKDINISRKINFYNLQLEINNQSRIPTYLSNIYIKSVFSLFDNGNINYLNDYLNNYLILFYKDIKVENKLGELFFDKKYSSQMDYLSFYIRNYISYTLLSNTSIKNSLNIINNYIILSKNIYFNSSDKDRIKTGIHEGIFFLEKLDKYIRSKLFKKNRSEKGLLIKTSSSILDIENIKILKSNIKKLNLSISNNILLLENKESFKKIKEDFSEYFEALLDYELYVYNNDKVQNDILNMKTIGTKSNYIELSKSDFLNYMMQFDGVNNNSINNMKINIINKEYYKVENIYINGSALSFNLYPYEGNKINNIFIFGVEKNKQLFYNSTYYLDKQKKDFEEKAKNIDSKEKDKYDFKKFFINRFFKKDTNKLNTTTENNIVEIEQAKESKVIIVFKSNVLLGSTGEFNLIKNIVNIKYTDLLVKRIGDIYDININGSLISTKMVKNKKKYGILYGNYILNTNSHYFNKIKMQFYSSYKDNEKKLGISGIKINFLGKINLEEFENKINIFFSNTQNIEFVYNLINSTFLEIQDIKINYDINNNEIIFNFKNKNKNIEISFKGSNITNISVNNIEIKGFNDLNNLPNILLIISK